MLAVCLVGGREPGEGEVDCTEPVVDCQLVHVQSARSEFSLGRVLRAAFPLGSVIN